MQRAIPGRTLRGMGTFALLATALVLTIFGIPKAAYAETTAVPTADAAYTNAQALADALNAGAPAEAPNAAVSDDGTTVTLLGPVELEGGALEIAVPANETLTFDVGDNTLSLFNGEADDAGQIVASGEGSLVLSGGGAIVSKTADGTIPALQVLSGMVALNVDVTIETPTTHIAALRVNGGTLELNSSADIVGAATDSTGMVGVLAGELDLNGATLHCTGDDTATALIVAGGVAKLSGGTVQRDGETNPLALDVMGDGVGAVTGATIDGDIMTEGNATLTISSGRVNGGLYAFEQSDLTVTVNEDTGESALFERPVPPQYLEGIGAVEWEFGGNSPDAAFWYFADMADAEADAANWPDINYATVSNQGYLCYCGFLDNADAAKTYLNNYFEAIGRESKGFEPEGPVFMAFAMIQPGSTLHWTFMDPDGEVMTESTQEAAGPDADFMPVYIPMALPDTDDPDLAPVGMGTYSVEISSPRASTVYSTADLGISQVTLNVDGGTLSAGASNVFYRMQHLWVMNESPTRPGYRLSGWTSAPTPDMVEWSAFYGGYIYVIPREPGAFTFTAQWESDVVDVSRLWNPYNGAHLLTTDANEVSTLEDAGWKDEGTVFSEYGSAYPESTPVMRVYNPFNGDHLYSTSRTEVNSLVQLGWKDEGVKFYGSPDKTHPVYRLWNSLQTADGGLGSHLWTADHNEYITLPNLPPVGAWQQENAVWYAISVPTN